MFSSSTKLFLFIWQWRCCVSWVIASPSSSHLSEYVHGEERRGAQTWGKDISEESEEPHYPNGKHKPQKMLEGLHIPSGLGILHHPTGVDGRWRGGKYVWTTLNSPLAQKSSIKWKDKSLSASWPYTSRPKAYPLDENWSFKMEGSLESAGLFLRSIFSVWIICGAQLRVAAGQ